MIDDIYFDKADGTKSLGKWSLRVRDGHMEMRECPQTKEGRPKVENAKETDYTDNQEVIWERLGIRSGRVEGIEMAEKCGTATSDRRPES